MYTTLPFPFIFKAGSMRSLACAGVVGLVVLAGCGGGGGGGSVAPVASGYPGNPASCEVSGQRAWLRDYMNDAYFWYDKQGVPNAAATSMDAYFDSLLYQPTDRYSYSQTTASANQMYVEGTRTGYGYALDWLDAARTTLAVRLVEPKSPVGLAGLQRGDRIVSINGQTSADIANGGLTAVDTTGVARTFVVRNAAGAQRSFVVQSATYALSPVNTVAVLTAPNGAKTGYLMYQEFIAAGEVEMGAAFDRFRTEGITELVLDLRYNGGGSTQQARYLAGLVAGSAQIGKVFAQFQFNAKNTARNFTQNFVGTSGGLPTAPLDNLARVIVITSPSTASASELVINALRPYKTVVTIGDTTYGKPYAFQPEDVCGTTYNAVNIVVANALNFSDYSAGFAPTCAVADDLDHPLGDPVESRTAAALGFIQSGACPARASIAKSQPGTPSLGFGDISPPQMRVD
jgi:carboxyl-terminal processing protease